KKAREAATALYGTAKTIRIVRLPNLPEKGDVSDWLDADPYNAERLVGVCLAAPLWVAGLAPPIGPNENTGTWRDNIFTAATLRTMNFKAIQYVGPGIIPEGVTILAGKPQNGKYWLALDIALAVADRRFVLGEIKPPQGDVLYAALEDNQRRLSKRICKIMAAADVDWSSSLALATRWRRLDDGGTDDIKEWATSVANPRLVILDTLAGVRPDRNARDSLYDGDYKALAELHAWANETGIAVLILHHTRKMDADDPIDTISGSLGSLAALTRQRSSAAAAKARPFIFVVETFARDSLYDGDYKALAELHAWANETSIAVLILHHTRKMDADDPIDTISGSLGLAGCADTSAILSRSSKGTTLYLRGRDVEEQEHAVVFNAETCRWTILGDAAEVQRSYARGKILTALEEATDLMSPAELTTVTGLNRNIVDQRLHHMMRDAKIIKAGRGLYAHAKRTDLVHKAKDRRSRKSRKT